jgi:hypothetical protein
VIRGEKAVVARSQQIHFLEQVRICRLDAEIERQRVVVRTYDFKIVEDAVLLRRSSCEVSHFSNFTRQIVDEMMFYSHLMISKNLPNAE